MRSEWRDITLGDIVDVKQGLAINAKSKHLIVDVGMPLLRITDLLNDNQVQFINAKEAPKQCLANADDLIYTRTGQVGYVFRGKVGVVHNNCFRVIPKDESTTRGFLYWFLSQNSIRKYANDIASGSVQKDLNHAAFYSIPLSIPSKATQLKIEKILNSIEDKIELNRKMNQTLEEMAQALFKSWFVDFDPVHAKAECSSDEELEAVANQLGISKEVLELFPSEFEESELGMIPKGWEVKKLGETLHVNPSYKLQKNTLSKYVELSNLSTTLLSIDGYKYREFTGGGAKFKNGDTILVRITPSLENGKRAFVDFLNEDEIAWGSTEYIILSGKRNFQEWSYLLSISDNFRNYAISNMNGSSGRQRVPNDAVKEYKIAIAKDEIYRVFSDVVNLLFKNIKSNAEQIQTLQKTRDTLLPKLLSGELDVSELELDM